jgi:hypothetical protein
MAVVIPYVIMAVISVVVGYAMTALQKPIQGPKIGDIATQTSKEGGPRLIIWGIVRPIGGNVIACSDPIIVKSSSGGKGGGGSQETESVYRTYAIGVCEGPITGFRRIWRNNKLVYDARLDSEGNLNAWGAANNPIFLQKATFYLGGFGQLPDPSLEGIFGVGEVPAMRGTCYMVMDYEDLTTLGGALPQWIFEVVRAEGIFLTSRPYAVEDIEATDANQSEMTRIRYTSHHVDENDATESGPPLITSGLLEQTFFLRNYEDWPPEATDADAPLITGGNLVDASVPNIEYAYEEATDASAPLITSGNLEQTFFLIEYNNYPAEATDAMPPIITGGTLE